MTGTVDERREAPINCIPGDLPWDHEDTSLDDAIAEYLLSIGFVEVK